MRVTPDMTTEGGARLDEVADFLDLDGYGLKVTADRGEVRFTAHSTSWPNASLDFEPDDIDALCELLQEKKREALR